MVFRKNRYGIRTTATETFWKEAGVMVRTRPHSMAVFTVMVLKSFVDDHGWKPDQEECLADEIRLNEDLNLDGTLKRPR